MPEEEKTTVEEKTVGEEKAVEEKTVGEEKAGETDRDAEPKAASDSSESSGSTVDVSAIPESVPAWTVVTMKTIATDRHDGSESMSLSVYLVFGGDVYDLTEARSVTWDDFVSYYVVMNSGSSDDQVTSVQVGYAMPGHDLQRLYINREVEHGGK